VVPFDESFDDDAQHRQSQMDRRFLQRFAALVLAGGEPELELLDVSTLDLAERDHVRVVIDQPVREDPQRRVDGLRGRRSRGHRDLGDVVVTRRREHRGVRGDAPPALGTLLWFDRQHRHDASTLRPSAAWASTA